MKHYGDITKIKGSEVPIVDIVTGGSPCQDLSVAGKRAGLEGERSGLFMEQIRIIKEMRDYDRNHRQGATDGRPEDDIRPRYMVWENVPGAFSSNKGEDFRAVLEETAKVAERDACIPGPPDGKWPHSGCIVGDGWSIAWRVHDAQFWGVPQRRKRIALVADFGGGSAPEILFEREGVSGDSPESGKAGEGAATDVRNSVTESGRCLNGVVCYRKKGHPQNAEQGQGWEQTEINDTLNAFDNGESRTPTVVCYDRFSERQNGVPKDSGDMSPTVTAAYGTSGNNTPLVMTMQAIGEYKERDVASGLKARDYKDATDLVVYGLGGYIVRRLSPLECERLQGYPDRYTDIGDWVDSKGKKRKGESDSPRYKALGNSIALPFWEWMAERMLKHVDHDRPTMASLFDGIGGFPLVYSRHGCDPVWASEIEEFPIAVTKIRFPESEDKECPIV